MRVPAVIILFLLAYVCCFSVDGVDLLSPCAETFHLQASACESPLYPALLKKLPERVYKIEQIRWFQMSLQEHPEAARKAVVPVHIEKVRMFRTIFWVSLR